VGAEEADVNWSDYPNFTEAEFRCKHTGKCEMEPEFMARLQRLRDAYGKPMTITSGYRDRTHPVEAKKSGSGAHTTGRACDVAVRGADALRLIGLALELGFTGIGVQQKGGSRFIHLDDVTDGLPRPMIWSY
jgi:zinc D-Ala-D-Ala carboxypeptidase